LPLQEGGKIKSGCTMLSAETGGKSGGGWPAPHIEIGNKFDDAHTAEWKSKRSALVCGAVNHDNLVAAMGRHALRTARPW